MAWLPAQQATTILAAAPPAAGVMMVKGVAETARLSPPLFRSTRPVPESPLTVPPIVKVLVAQLTATLVTFAPASVPLPLATVQVWPIGCTNTATLYAEPSAMAPNA